jgi:bifunctional DNA-binding transcriptional regulator/antitoxin component of YhaV-PrlF toxin-antitoxin module
METPTYVQFGKDRRFAIPAKFCKQANLRAGERFVLSRQGKQFVLTPLEDEAEQMRQELRTGVGKNTNLMEDLRALRAADAADEAHHR